MLLLQSSFSVRSIRTREAGEVRCGSTSKANLTDKQAEKGYKWKRDLLDGLYCLM